MLRFFVALFTALFLLSSPRLARAEKVVVLPFSAPKGGTKPELDEARKWTEKAVIERGHTTANAGETMSAERAVADGNPDTSSEYRAAGKAAGAKWTLVGRIERHDVAPSKGAAGGANGSSGASSAAAPGAAAPAGGAAVEETDGYTLWRVELEACQVESGRVESLAREVDPDEAPAEIGEMLVLLLRPEGIANADLPWESRGPRKPKAKPKPKPAPPPPPPPPPPREPEKPAVKHAYAENRPAAVGLSVGISNALSRPDAARGPSWAMPIGAAMGYALDAVPGLELRGIFTSQVIGPRAIQIAAGARYAIPVFPTARIFVGPEILLGAHVALGADKTARALGQGSAFLAWGLTEQVQLEIAGDLAAALGGTGTLVLGGGTLRGLYRF